ncbi:MAG: hypothetical protein AAFQ44_05695 [Pseudomonadota bacterium]
MSLSLQDTPSGAPSKSRLTGTLVFDILLGLGVIAFFGMVGFAALQEVSDRNSYAALAAAWLDGRLHVDKCFDVDCVTTPDGRVWVIFPPVPALLALPFVAIFGISFSGFHVIGGMLLALSGVLWRRNFRALGLDDRMSTWLGAAALFGTPAIFVVLRSDLVWFFAQTVAFTLITAAIHEALHRQRAMLIGLYIGLAFLTRQMSIFYCPLMLAMIMNPTLPTVRIDREVIMKTLRIALPVATAIGLYFLYNYLRFGAIFETGYSFLEEPAEGIVPNDPIDNRLNTSGLFSKDYVFFNVMYLFFQGFHLQFTGDQTLTPVRLDPWGTSLLAASPFLMIALLAPVRRELVIGWITIAIIAGITLFYHSNGFSQVNGQRYTLDWLPILFLFLGYAMTQGRFEVARLLILYALGLNAVAFGLMAVVV